MQAASSESLFGHRNESFLLASDNILTNFQAAIELDRLCRVQMRNRKSTARPRSVPIVGVVIHIKAELRLQRLQIFHETDIFLARSRVALHCSDYREREKLVQWAWKPRQQPENNSASSDIKYEKSQLKMHAKPEPKVVLKAELRI